MGRIARCGRERHLEWKLWLQQNLADEGLDQEELISNLGPSPEREDI